MITLGIHDGHTATATIAKNGKILVSISEERIVRNKEWSGFPIQSIKRCMEITDIKAEEIDGVGIVGLAEHSFVRGYNIQSFNKIVFNLLTHLLPKSIFSSKKWVSFAQWFAFKSRKKKQHLKLLDSIGIRVKPEYFEHHQMHAATAHLQCPWGKENNLVITNDGSGDGVTATVNIGRGNKIERLETIAQYNSIGYFYTAITKYLGMKPISHEYKVMGLAPYAKEEYGLKTYELIKDWFQIKKDNPLVFENNSGYWGWGFIRAFKKLFSTEHRFDNIAWSAQHLIEEIQTKWIKNIIKETGIKNVVLSGGCFMNVKANHKILKIEELENLFIFPSCGDESLSMGAALQRMINLGGENTEPLGPIYFGDEFDNSAIEKELKKWKNVITFTKQKDIHQYVGKMLNKGDIIARYFGRMEWGARALGNRSIIADGRKPNVIQKINEAIKNRDFWMPFAPSILFERVHDYFDNPQKFYGPYMVMAFPSKPLAVEHFKGALHPYDYTGRPQMVKEDWNPEYYRVLKSFENESGDVGGVLNTSFNIHGEAIVRTPSDALNTFLNSGLDGLAIGDYYVKKTNDTN